METKIESKTGQVALPSKTLYEFFTDLTRLNDYKDKLPADKISDWEVSNDELKCTVGGMAKVTLKITERQPEAVKMQGEGMGVPFLFWAQVKSLSDTESALKFTLKADMNFAIKMVAEKPIKDSLDKLIDTISQKQF